jgi:maltose alpha-D-glucosyltransferase/alpha-amylase
MPNRAQAIERMRNVLPAKIDALKIRHHGDLHLGQILIVKDDAVIIDFEGEPAASIAARHRKAPAARDLAGLVRSLDYAAVSALNRGTLSSPEEAARLMTALENWRRQATEALVASVHETCNDSRLWPRDPAVAERLLRFFIIEKAVYEIGYEMRNRPDWVHVPLAGLWRTLFPSGGDAS